MKKANTKFTLLRRVTVFVCVNVSLILLSSIAFGATGNAVRATAFPQGIEDDGAVTTFIYELEGRPDPFVPFITPKATTANSPDPNEIIEDDLVLTGMQLFEPGQLTLVAVLYAQGSPMAMVEDVTGKGYILTKGIPIGRRGVVSDINSSAVVITETARTRAGKEIKSTVTMKLKKEGDE